MYAFLVVMHVIACLVLIGVILLQAGKGGGLAETFGGGGGIQSIFGTKTSKFLAKATGACAVIFLTTSLTLTLLSAQKQQSLVEKEAIKEEKAKPATRQEAVSQPAPEQPKSESGDKQTQQPPK